LNESDDYHAFGDERNGTMNDNMNYGMEQAKAHGTMFWNRKSLFQPVQEIKDNDYQPVQNEQAPSGDNDDDGFRKY
jgi:hypothetical protein